ncbi:putative damage-inducible protein DinB [Streptosporangium album]|uniref:Putative damage-inducible protein DinB n=1 Tax=Streptosporangium album TaxID=47479 RepID=A0A7W7W6M4_9ACTN|nr:DinB family protein [Streptosporangium album]MBB4936417.1 putative damage-inducible protein DinB [Streptosporangium album]
MADNRVDPPYVADELPMLRSWLDWHRETLAVKCAGLSEEQLRLRAAGPSTLSLLGLVRHLTEVERHWFRNILNGENSPGIYWTDQEPDGDFDLVDTASAGEAFARWHTEIARARELSAGLSLETVGKQQRKGEDVSLRWIFIHMIEEYARHNGHADIIREQIDGVTGE